MIDIFVVLLVIAAVGLGLWAITRFLGSKIPKEFMELLYIVVIGGLIWWLLTIFGVIGLIDKVKIGAASLLTLIYIIVGSGLIVWAITKYIPMEANIKQIFSTVAIIVVIVVVVLAITGLNVGSIKVGV